MYGRIKLFVKLLGIGDILAGLVAIAAAFDNSLVPIAIIFLAAKWLMIKGAIFAFSGNYASFVDILCGIYLIALGYGWGISFFTVIAIIWIMQKGLVSLI